MRFKFCGDLDVPEWVLAEIATLSKLTPVRIKLLTAQVIASCIEGKIDYSKIADGTEETIEGKADLKGAISALHFIITNAAKHDVDESALIQEIQQLGLPKENSDALGKHYRETKENLQSALAEDSYRLSRLISTDWRVDGVIYSSDGVPPAPLIHVKLTVDNRPQDGRAGNSVAASSQAEERAASARFEDVAFEMSQDKLDVLIYELSHAQSVMQRLEG